jgi:threonine synthase
MELYREDTSVVLRYATHMKSLSRHAVARSSIREGARIIELPAYRDVLIDVLDLSTLSTTETFKDWVACVATAGCLARGDRTLLTQTTGNTGNAIGKYASRLGIRCLILYPAISRRKVKNQVAKLDGIQFIEVDAPEGVLRECFSEIGTRLKIPSVPLLEDQLEGNKLRAYFIREAGRELGRSWEWHAQAISSAYGIFGFYQGVSEIREQDGSTEIGFPRLLGIQQEAVSPYSAAISGIKYEVNADVVEPTLVRSSPSAALIQEMHRICSLTNGIVMRLDNARYFALEKDAIEILETNGVLVDIDSKIGSPRERAGIYALTGVMDAIEKGIIRKGSRVLAVFTGGARSADEEGEYEPSLTADTRNVEDILIRALRLS